MEIIKHHPITESILRTGGSLALLASIVAPVASLDTVHERTPRAPLEKAVIPERVQFGPDTKSRPDSDQ